MLPRAILLYVTRNMGKMDNTIRAQALDTLRRRLPWTWQLQPEESSKHDILAQLRAPDGTQSSIIIEVKSRLEPRDVRSAMAALQPWRSSHPNGIAMVASSFLTPRTRELLTEADVGYLDLAGNCRLVCDTPGLFICTTGAQTNPQPEGRPTRSLRGPTAGSVIRALCDFFPPVGVRELAARAQANPGYVSRLVEFLDREALIIRKPRGPVLEVNWQALLRRWAEDYTPFAPDLVVTFLEPRGLNALTDKLRNSPTRYAVTGSLAAAAVAPVAPPRLAVCYVDDPRKVGQELGLYPAEAGINVMLMTPFDEVVFQRTWSQGNLQFAALSQVAADLLRSPGRGPEEAAALLTYMAKNEHAWRS